MTDDHADTPRRNDTQAWTAAELAKIREIASKKLRKPQLVALFPGRTLGAIRLRLSHTRKAMGLGRPTPPKGYDLEQRTVMLAPDDPGVFARPWPEQQRPAFERSNAAYLEALMRIAA